MSIVNVILPDGTTYQTAEAIPSQTTTIINTIEERHEVTHTTDELNVPNVLIADHDEVYDVADTGPRDPNAISSQKFNQVPTLLYGNKFETRDHINDADATTDSSSIKMFRTIYIEPPPNKPAGFMAPTMFTSGSICVCGEGAIGYIPYSVSGQQIPNTEYRLGRGPTLGDRSHDNDGLFLQKEMADGLLHKVHISPDPTDPAILIESNRVGDFIHCVNVGPDQPVVDTFETQNTVFRVTSTGDISSVQMVDLIRVAYGAELMMEELAPQVERIVNEVSDNTAILQALQSRVTSIESQLSLVNPNP